MQIPATSQIALDPFDPAHRADPYPLYRRLRETAPVCLSPRGHWLISSYRHCVAVLRDPRFGHGTGQLLQGNNFRRPVAGRSLPFILLDPPEHTRLRRLVSRAFTPRTVAGMAPRIRQLVDDLLDVAIDKGDIDLMAEFAYPLPVGVISSMLGVPAADRDRMQDLSRLVANGVDPDFARTEEGKQRRDAAFGAFDDYFSELLARRRRHPGTDLLSELVQVRDAGQALTEGELLTTCILLYVAGHETTMDLIGNGMLALLRDRGQLARLRADSGLAEPAVEELLRFDPPTQLSRRTALADADIGGQAIKRGQQVVIMRGAANRDPEAFAAPDRLDLARAENRHLAFDGGIHFCLGAALARLEGQIAFTTLLRRAPRPELRTDAPRYRDSIVIRGLAELPVSLR